MVQFRSTDTAGNVSAWAPATGRRQHGQARPHGAYRPDRSPAARLAWQTSATISVTASGATDTGGAASRPTSTTSDRRRHDLGRGRRNASVNVTGQGQTLVQFRAVDAAGYTSNWSPAPAAEASTAPRRPTRPWQADPAPGRAWRRSPCRPAAPPTAAAAASPATSTAVLHRRSELERRRPRAARSRSRPRGRRRCGSGPWTTPATRPPGLARRRTVRIDRTPPTGPDRSAAAPPAGRPRPARSSPPAARRTPAAASPATSTARPPTTASPGRRPTTAATATISAQGMTLMRFRAVDNSGNSSSRTQGTVELDRTVPHRAHRHRRLDRLAERCLDDGERVGRPTAAAPASPATSTHLDQQRLDLVGAGRRVDP